MITNSSITLRASLVAAKHQSAMAEHTIQTFVYMARTFMVHFSYHWSEQGVYDVDLWDFAKKHAA